ncbi:MAG: right-handed parallel beta-helix repeat-containing protein [Candidatus Thorarchaeota archaeon]|jgi:parallel beta-helix repeat protein
MRNNTLILAIALAVFLTIGLSASSNEHNIANNTELVSQDLVKENIASAVVVTSDGMFAGAGFTGTGTESDPYILDGVTVTTESGGRGIYIQSTTAHFVIQNCLVNLTSVSSSYGIYLHTVDNGTIYNCEVIGTPVGIYVDYSEDINITMNTVRDGSNKGIDILRTPNVNIINNTITDILGYRGMSLFQTPNTNVTGNLVNRINYDSALSTTYGIFCEQTDNLTISNNEFRSTMRGTGISFNTGENIVMDSNVIWQASTGVRPYNTPGIVISNNNISCGYNYNLWMHTVTGAYVYGNSLHHTTNANGRAIHLQASSNGTYEFNDMFKCWYGMSIDSSSSNNTIHDNNIGWLDGLEYYGWDDRTTTPKNNWTSNQFSNYVSGDYLISGAAGVNDSSASLLSDSISPTIDSPDDIVINDTDTNKWVTWHPDDRFPGTYIFYINGTPQSTPIWCNSSISISLDAYAPEVYDLTVRPYDASSSNAVQDTVRVTVLDTQDPVFTSATADYTIEYGERVWFNITATDDTPAIKRGYENEGAPLWNNAWTSPLTLNWDNVFPSVGVHNYTIELIDKAGNSAVATCMVTVEDTTAPDSPDFPTDFSSETGEIAWVNFTLDDSHADSYEIWLDDTLNTSSTFIDDEYVSFKLNYTSPGDHNITLVAWDDYSNTLRITCIVTYADSTNPIVTGPSDYPFEAGSSSTVTWSWQELDPANYTIYENNTQMAFSTVFSGDIQHSLDHLTPGIWNITIILFDDIGNNDTDIVWVTVVDTTAPSLSGSTTITVELGQQQQVSWNVNDIDSWDQDGEWYVFVNESELASGIWDSSIITYDITPDIASYNVTVLVIDAYGNRVAFTTWVNGEDTTNPIISSPDDLTFDEGTEISQWVNWTCSDLDSYWYEITRNGTIVSSGSWDSVGFNVEVSLQGVGIWVYVLTIEDGSGNTASDEVIVTVNEVVTTTTTSTTTTTTTTSTTETSTTDTTTPPIDGDPTMMLIVFAGIGGAIAIIIVVFYLRSKK